MTRNIHVVAAAFAALLIFTFWTATVAAELLGGPAHVAAVKRAILYGVALLAPAMMALGATGFRLGRNREDALAREKRRRMPIIAANGVLVLIPAAVFLDQRAAVGLFDWPFYAVQGLELIAGGVNLALIGMNMRDGVRLAAHRADPSRLAVR